MEPDRAQASEGGQQDEDDAPREARGMPGDESDAGEQPPASAALSDERPDETQQATEQWLRRIPDDPAGLLKRKFRYQYQQRTAPPPEDEKTW